MDPAAVTVVGEPQTHHIVRYENLYAIAQKYDWASLNWPTTTATWITFISPGKPISASRPSGSSRSTNPIPAI